MAYSKTTWANGDVIDAAKLNNLEDGVAANDAAIGGMSTLSCEGTPGEDGDSNETITLDKQSGEFYTAVSAGRSVKIFFDFGGGTTAEMTPPISATKVDSSGTEIYNFRIIADDGAVYSVQNLSATDIVVLTKES